MIQSFWKKLLPFLLLLPLAGCGDSPENEPPGPPPPPPPPEKVWSLSADLAELQKGSYAIWLCSHRSNSRYGVQNGLPENSLEAIAYNISLGVDMIEIDTRTTSDGEIMLMHDVTVDRTTNGTGAISSMTYEEVSKLRLKDNTGKQTDYKIPTLGEALALCKNKCYINIDAAKKNISVKRLIDVINKHEMIDQVVIYTSEDRNFAADLINQDGRALIHPFVGSTQDIAYFSTRPQYNVQIVQLANGTLSPAVQEAGFLRFSNNLGEGDRNLLQGSYSGLVTMINNKISIVQTDYYEPADTYLASKDLRPEIPVE